MLVSPSILSANFADLATDIEMLNNSEATYIHCDIMDGVFVPNISFGFPLLATIKKITKLPLDVHLMIDRPERYVTEFRDVGADLLSVHYEQAVHLHRTIDKIKTAGMQAGVVLNPHTPIHCLTDIIGEVDWVLLMSVNPGFGGQKFIPHTLHKIRALKQHIVENNLKIRISVDGGITLENIAQLRDAGSDMIVAGNSVFKSINPITTIAQLTL